MSSTANPLGVFCDQLIAFFEDLTETYPEERDIATAASALKLLRRSNPRMIHTCFMSAVHREFARHILDEDEEYILRRAHEILNSQYSDINYAFWIFDKHWSGMSEANKSVIWKYMKSLILLSERVPASAL